MEDLRFSYGTAPIIEAIRKLVLEKKSRYDTILINITTIIRNNIDRSLTTNAIIKNIASELQEVKQDIADMYSECSWVTNPTVVFYMTRYERVIPLKCLRPIPKSQEKQLDVTNRIIKKLEKAKKGKYRIDNVTFYEMMTSPLAWPHTNLVATVKQLENSNNVILVSGAPCDYHICHKFPKMRLIRSFVGSVVQPKDFGDIVFKRKIPFTPETHALLGDKSHIKCLLPRKEKARLLNIAEQEHWTVKTSAFIRDSLKKNGFEVPFSIK